MVGIVFFLFMTSVRKCISQINSATVNWKPPQMIKNGFSRTSLRKTTLDGLEVSAEVARRYTKAIKRETLCSESYIVFVTSILLIAFVSVGKWNSLEVVRSRSAARPEERTVFVLLWGVRRGEDTTLTRCCSPPPSPNCHLSSVKEKNSTSAADFQSKT